MSHPASRRKSLQVWIFVLAMAFFWSALGTKVAMGGRYVDFLCYYTGGSAILRGQGHELYNLQAQFEAQRSFYPDLTNFVPFIRPPIYAGFMVAFAFFHLSSSFLIWVCLQIAVLVACIVWGWRRWGDDALVLAAMFLPAPLGIASGQDCAFILALIVVIFILHEKRSDLEAGAILGLGLVKFQLFTLWPLMLLIQRRWRIFAGAVLAVAAELLISFLLVGRAGFAAYVSLLRNAKVNSSPELMINVQSIALNFHVPNPYFVAALIALVVILCALLSWKSKFAGGVAAACIGSLLISSHSYGYDATFLLPTLWYAAFTSKTAVTKFVAVFLCSPVPYLMNLAGSPWSVTAPLVLLLLLTLITLEHWHFHAQSCDLPNPLANRPV
jgi:hypothetical protein